METTAGPLVQGERHHGFRRRIGHVLTDEHKAHTKATVLVALSHLHQLGMCGCALTILTLHRHALRCPFEAAVSLRKE